MNSLFIALITAPLAEGFIMGDLCHISRAPVHSINQRRFALECCADGPTTRPNELKDLPRIFPATELLAKALKASSRLKEDYSIANHRQRMRKFAAEQLSSFSKELTKPLGIVAEGYGRILSRLPPFESVVADLTIRHRLNKQS
mmetsp:Transcript_26227/g.68965  ORF Transcript_26227/g.68965 Transcript_26227/m.68965 type:complete len:144 (-) Transcript_26227:38-469(-)